MEIGSSIFDEDTDFDGLTDYEEYSLKTNPAEGDTDSDGIWDKLEIELLTNPLLQDTNGNGILDGEERFEITRGSDFEYNDSVNPSVTMITNGSNIETLNVSKVYGYDLFISEDIPGYMGGLYEFSIYDSDENATIKFEYEPVLSRDGKSITPRIFYFDELEQCFVEVDGQVIYQNSVEVTVDKLGMYILLDKEAFDNAWMQIKAPVTNETGLDIVFVIDSSGSMTSNDKYGLRRVATNNFIDKLGENDRAAIVDFDSTAKIYQELTNDKDLLKKAVAKIDSAGGTNILVGLSKGMSLFPYTTRQKTIIDDYINNSDEKFYYYIEDEIEPDINLDDKTILEENVMENYNKNTIGEMSYEELFEYYTAQSKSSTNMQRQAENVIILLTDGVDGNSANKYTTLLNIAKEKNITIYTIGLGTGINSSVLEFIAQKTEGDYFHASLAEDLTYIFDQTANELIDFVTDTDKDGLSDYFEQKINEGSILLGTGKTLELNIPLDIYNEDSDGDGLKDGEEIEFVLSDDGKSVKYMRLKSDPTKIDTDNDGLPDGAHIKSRTDSDGDGISDTADKNKLTYNITDRTMSLVAGVSYENLENNVGKTLGQIYPNIMDKNNEMYYLSELKDAKIIYANDSIRWKPGKDEGLGSIALEIPRYGQTNAIIFALRGTEPDTLADIESDIRLGIGFLDKQPRAAVKEYYKIEESNRGKTLFVTGHSLGGRLAHEVTETIYDKNKKNVATPKRTVTFNALGYNGIDFIDVNAKRYSSENMTHYFYSKDLVGDGFGDSWVYKRAGENVELGYAPNTSLEDATYTVPLIGDVELFIPLKAHGIELFYNDYRLRYPRRPYIY